MKKIKYVFVLMLIMNTWISSNSSNYFTKRNIEISILTVVSDVMESVYYHAMIKFKEIYEHFVVKMVRVHRSVKYACNILMNF